MQPHKIVSESEWIAARKEYLAVEKKFTEARDELSRQRRELPWVKVDKPYVFDGPQGKLYIAKKSSIGLWPFEELPLKSFPKDLNQWLKGFGQDRNGELYVVASKQAGPTGNSGKIWKLVFVKDGSQ